MIVVPAKYFDVPPYRAELFNASNLVSGVMNKNGFNCLTFPSKPGAVLTSYNNALRIAELWNKRYK